MPARAAKRPDICELHEVFLRNLKARRKQLGLTQATVAEAAAMSQPYYAALEAGTRSPGLEVIGRVAAALEIPASHLLIETPLDPSDPPTTLGA